MIKLYYGIDGTGDADDDVYRENFSQSFVNVFKDEFPFDQKIYRRGPTLLGTQTKTLGANASEFVDFWSRYHVAEERFICLAGYSRGGAAVIHACNLLKRKGIRIGCLLLFDAVDRAVDVFEVDAVPSNVDRVFHARRSPKSNSRPYFGNCGTSLLRDNGSSNSQDYKEEFFSGTHGSIGGTPWKRLVRPPTKQQASDLALSMAKSAFLGPAMVANNVLAKMDNRIVEDGIATNVTYDEDRQAAAAAGFWMRTKLWTYLSDIGLTTCR